MAHLSRFFYSRAAISCAALCLFVSGASAATIALLTGEDEYRTAETLPAFARAELEPMGHKIVHVAAPAKDGEHRFENIEALKDADLIVVSVRRRAPQKELIEALRAHLAAGKPMV